MLLRQKILPRREAAIRVSDEVQALNRSEFLQQLSDVASIYRTTQRELWGTFGLAVIVSFAIAWLATIYAGRLEARIRLQHLREGEYVRDLRRLSTKLVTAQEEERRVIARELHDEIWQGLTAIKVELTIAQRAIEQGASAHALDDARSIAEHALHTVRDLSHLLHPALLDDLGLAAAVDWYVNGFAKRHGIVVELVQDRMSGRLRPDVEVAAYRIIQEALTNVARHARASSARVCLRRLAGALIVTVDDDGVGFDAQPPREEGMAPGLGLIGIRERASQLGGTLRLERAAEKGTRLTVELPGEPRPDAAMEPDAAEMGFRAAISEALGG
jgi:signal transduction histidine kinase